MLPTYRTTLPGQRATASLLDTRAPEPSWRSDARCANTDPRLFDPLESHEPVDHRNQRLHRAREVCARCPVATRCLIEALKHRDVGVRGGLLLSRPGGTTARITARRIADPAPETPPRVAA